MAVDEFSERLRSAISDAWDEFRVHHPQETPFAFALIPWQWGEGMSYAVATEEGLLRTVAAYEKRGYRLHGGPAAEEVDRPFALAAWLRWANPEDGWHWGEFPDRCGHLRLDDFATQPDDPFEALSEACIAVLASLRSESAGAWAGRIVLGVTSGEDPREFVESASRCNPPQIFTKLRDEFSRGETLGERISRRKDFPSP